MIKKKFTFKKINSYILKNKISVSEIQKYLIEKRFTIHKKNRATTKSNNLGSISRTLLSSLIIIATFFFNTIGHRI